MNKINEINYNNSNAIYQSNNYGPFKIVQDLGMVNKSHKFIIEFINTSFRCEVEYNQIVYGCIRDDTIWPYDDRIIYNTKVYKNKYGDFIILRDDDKNILDNDKLNRRLIIKFIKTGSEVSVLAVDALKGRIRDPLNAGTYVGDVWQSKHHGSAEVIELR